MDENEKRRLFNLLYKGQGDSRTIGLLLINELEGENKKLDESLIDATKQNIERQEIIDSLKKEHEKQNEMLKQIDSICELALDGATNWDEEQLEGFIKQIKKILY